MVSKSSKRVWQVAEAKAKLSELLEDARSNPQTIERRGTPIAVVLDVAAYAATTELLHASSAEARMARFLATSAKLRAAGGVTLRVGRRLARPSPFGEER